MRSVESDAHKLTIEVDCSDLGGVLTIHVTRTEDGLRVESSKTSEPPYFAECSWPHDDKRELVDLVYEHFPLALEVARLVALTISRWVGSKV